MDWFQAESIPARFYSSMEQQQHHHHQHSDTTVVDPGTSIGLHSRGAELPSISNVWGFDDTPQVTPNWTEQQHVPRHGWRACGKGTSIEAQQAAAMFPTSTTAPADDAARFVRAGGPGLLVAAHGNTKAVPVSSTVAVDDPSHLVLQRKKKATTNNNIASTLASYSPEGMMPSVSSDGDYLGMTASSEDMDNMTGLANGAVGAVEGLANGSITTPSGSGFGGDVATSLSNDGDIVTSPIVAAKQPKKKSGRPRAPKKKAKAGAAAAGGGGAPRRRRVPRKVKRPRAAEVGLGADGRERAMGLLMALVDSPLSEEFHKPVIQLHPEVR